jgi:thiol-disulfide isomerase/thioredoxin
MPLSLLDGKTIKLSDFAGKVVVLNFWATWCGPCRAEMPELIRLYSDYKNRGVEVIGVASKQNDASLDEVKKFVRQMNVNYKIVYEDGSFAPPLLQAIHARGVIPQSVILSRTGQVIEHKQGYNPAMTPAQLRDVIEQALKG